MLKRQWYRLVHYALVTLGFGAGVAASYLSNTPKANWPSSIATYFTPQLTVADLQKSSPKSLILIDVRSPEEYFEDRITSSTLIPLADLQTEAGQTKLQSLVAKVPPGQQPTLVLYCTTGPRSIKAYHQLQESGLNTVVLTGGLTAWRKSVTAEQEKVVLTPLLVSR